MLFQNRDQIIFISVYVFMFFSCTVVVIALVIIDEL